MFANPPAAIERAELRLIGQVRQVIICRVACSIWLAVVTTLAFDEYACCATIRLVNSVAISTLEPSTEPITRFPPPLVLAATARGEPLDGVAVKDCPFWPCSALGALKVTMGICATVRVWPLL